MKSNCLPTRLFAPFLAIGALWPLSLGAISLHFDQEEYTVTPGDEITISTHFDEPVPEGLEAYHIRFNLIEGLFELTEEDFHIPDELDFDVFEPGAITSVSVDSAEVKGFSEFGSTPYQETGFIGFTAKIDVNAPAGEQTLTLEIPGENGFVDGEGNSIEGEITLGSATITVTVPPPKVVDGPESEPETGDVTVQFEGLPGRTYRVEVSEDLTDWDLLEEVAADSEGEIMLEDSEAADADRRFYRLVDQ